MTQRYTTTQLKQPSLRTFLNLPLQKCPVVIPQDSTTGLYHRTLPQNVPQDFTTECTTGLYHRMYHRKCPVVNVPIYHRNTTGMDQHVVTVTTEGISVWYQIPLPHKLPHTSYHTELPHTDYHTPVTTRITTHHLPHRITTHQLPHRITTHQLLHRITTHREYMCIPQIGTTGIPHSVTTQYGTVLGGSSN